MATPVENVVVFGDSVAFGYGNAERFSWVNLLAAHYYRMNATSPNAQFHDLSCPGDTSTKLLSRVQNELPGRVRAVRQHLSVVALGGQDMWENMTAHGVPDRFTHPALREMCMNTMRAARKLKEYGTTLVVGPTVCRATLAGWAGMEKIDDNMLRNGLRHVGDVLRENFDLAATSERAERYFRYVGLLHTSENDPAFTLHRDGIHPDRQGQEWIFEQVRPVFDSMVQPVPDACPERASAPSVYRVPMPPPPCFKG